MKKAPSNLIYQKNGISLVEVIVALGLVGIIGAAFTAMFMSSERQQSQMNLKFQADVIRKNLTVVLNNSASWQNTIASAANNRTSGSSLDCLLNSTPCTNNGLDLTAGGTALTNIAIREIRDNGSAGGQIAYALNSASAGFTSQGTVCNTFIAPPAVGNDGCPLKFNITWTALCAASCVQPQVLLNIIPIYNSATKSTAFNPANYSAEFIQGTGASTSSGTESDTITWF